MKYTLDSNIEILTHEEIEEYYEEFKSLTNKAIKEKNNFISTYLAYTLPIQRMFNTYEKALENKTFYKDNRLLTYRTGYEIFLKTLWSALEGDDVNADYIFSLGKVSEHISLWWHKQEKTIFNPKTDKMESIDECIEKCNKYFMNFENEGNRFEFLLISCISLSLYGLSYCIENNKDCSHYDCNHILYYIYKDLRCIIKENIEIYKSDLFKEEFKSLQKDIKNALSAEAVEDIKKLREEYKSELYIPKVYGSSKYNF